MREKTRSKKLLLNMKVKFLARRRTGGFTCSICQIPKKTFQMVVFIPDK